LGKKERSEKEGVTLHDRQKIRSRHVFSKEGNNSLVSRSSKGVLRLQEKKGGSSTGKKILLIPSSRRSKLQLLGGGGAGNANGEGDSNRTEGRGLRGVADEFKKRNLGSWWWPLKKDIH